MKTHQEIHDAIEDVKRLPMSGLDVEVTRILHALNDRIEALGMSDKDIKLIYARIENVDKVVRGLCDIHP